MAGNYYDVVVLGSELGPLCAAALLAKRGFRVLVAGQGMFRNRYPCMEYEFVYKPFVLNGATSPVVSRVIEELSIGQLFNNAEVPSEIRYQIVQPRNRVSVYNDERKTISEFAREFPSYAGKISGILSKIERYSRDFETLIQSDLVVPAENFFERRDFARAMVQHPFLSNPRLNFLELLDVAGSFRDCLMAPLSSFGEATMSLPPLTVARAIASWLGDTRYIRKGLDGLRQILCERIVEQGGDVQEQFQANSIRVSRGRVMGVQFRGRTEAVSTRIVLTDLPPSSLAALVEPGEWTSRFRAMMEDHQLYQHGYALNLGVRSEVIPTGMADTVFLITENSNLPFALRIEKIPQKESSLTGLNISCTVPHVMRKKIDSGVLRDTMLDEVRRLIPYLDNYLEVIHSPFDTFGAISLTGGASGRNVPPVPHPEQIPLWIVHTPAGYSGIGTENLTHRTGIKGLLMSGTQVNVGLGSETDMLSAWGAAKIAGKMDPARQRLVRSMRAHIEM
ncbi:MAG: NAD(P)/FAD-dependent oxidoreductase [Deltaproteobacteria bacterium]|nr:NAD(P)/FAD-dependent oxidoreductase [Deltaproteobacteria bacterium]